MRPSQERRHETHLHPRHQEAVPRGPLFWTEQPQQHPQTPKMQRGWNFPPSLVPANGPAQSHLSAGCVPGGRTASSVQGCRRSLKSPPNKATQAHPLYETSPRRKLGQAAHLRGAHDLSVSNSGHGALGVFPLQLLSRALMNTAAVFRRELYLFRMFAPMTQQIPSPFGGPELPARYVPPTFVSLLHRVYINFSRPSMIMYILSEHIRPGASC